MIHSAQSMTRSQPPGRSCAARQPFATDALAVPAAITGTRPARLTARGLAMALLASVWSLTLTACSPTRPAAAPAAPIAVPNPPALENTAWVLADLRSSAPDLGTGMPARKPVTPGTGATLAFAQGRASGSDGCNRFTVPYTTKAGELTWTGKPASTQMACSSDAMERGDAFMRALTGASGYRVVNGNLQLLSGDGTVRATFTPQARSLAGTAWRVTAINNGKGGVVSLVADSTVTLEFGADGQASGSAGCNRFTSAYRADGESLSFQSAAATRRMCAAEGLMEQEQAFLNALSSVALARREGDRLELRTAGGALAALLERTSTAP